MQDALFHPEHGPVLPRFFHPAPVVPAPLPLPLIPTLASTRLQLELLLGEPTLDLRAASEAILADPGATLQIFRLLGEEFPESEDRPTRIEDCLAALPIEQWYRAVCEGGTTHHGPLVSQWQRCRRVAECARELARHTPGISPEQAYLVGLLHCLGGLPRLLGWQTRDSSASEQHALGLMLADHWRLPHFLLSAIREAQSPAAGSRWPALLHAAHQLAAEAEA